VIEKLKLKQLRAPSKEEIVFQYLAEAIEGYHNQSTLFERNFKPNINQQRFQEIIETTQVPEGQSIHILLYGGVGCLDEDTFIPFHIRRPDGSVCNWKGGTISRLFERFHRIKSSGKGKNRVVPDDHTFTVASVDESNHRIFVNEIVDVIDNGFKESFEVITDSGRSIIATANHPFLTRWGYIPLEHLRPSHPIYVHTNQQSTKGREKRKTRKYLFFKHHPVGGRKVVNGCTYFRVGEHRAMVEAQMNGLSLEDYKDRLNSGNLVGLRFLTRDQHVHHKDGDCHNNVLDNLEVMSKEEHDRLHNDALEVPRISYYAVEEHIISIRPVGVRHVYDITMKAPTHNFVADGFVVHNSGKTWAALFYALGISLKHPNVKTLCVRRTHSDIAQSIYQETYTFLDRFTIPYKKNDQETTIKLQNGSFFFMRSDKSLVRAKASKSDALGSQAFSIAILEEADSLSEELANTVPGRLRQNIPGFRKVIIYICNPPSENHWLYRKFFKNNDPHDPKSPYRALHCAKEGNKENLPPGYLESVERDYSRDPSLNERLSLGNFAPDVKGDPVFQAFDRRYHVSKEPLVFNPKLPMFRSWDFGWRGTAIVIGQDDVERKQIRILKEFFYERTLLDTIAIDVLNQCWQLWRDIDWVDYMDPAGVQKRVEGPSAFDILCGKGLRPKGFKSTIEFGLSIIEQQLKLLTYRRDVVDVEYVKPGFIIDPSCRHLINAFVSGYCNEKDAPIDVIRPVKDGFYDHIMDALRYAMVCLRRDQSGRRDSAYQVPQRQGYQPLEGYRGPNRVIQVGSRKPNLGGGSQLR